MTARHKTFRGKEFNMSAFSEKNADTRAVGNLNMNARGDVLDAKGQVKVSAKKISQTFSKLNNKKSRQVSLKEDTESSPVNNPVVTPDQPKAKEQDVTSPLRTRPTVAADQKSTEIVDENKIVARREIRTDKGPAYEIEYADGSMEVRLIEK